MKLEKLIDKQIIEIDDHKWGTGELKKWDPQNIDVHIDKKTNLKLSGKDDQVLIKLPINSTRALTIENKKEETLNKIPRYIEKEIKKAFENKEVRQNFIRDLITVLTNFQSNLDNLEKARIALKNISKHFGLNYEPYRIDKDISEVLNSYTEQYIDKNGRKFYATIDRRKIILGEVADWNELKE